MESKNKKPEKDLAKGILYPKKMISPQRKGINEIENSNINSN